MALSAISAGVTSGVASAAGKFTSLSALNGETLTAGVLRAGVSNAIGQGVGIATGLQKRFDWAGLATAGVVGGVTALANQLPWNKVPGLARLPDKLGEAARGGLVGAAAAVAGAASRSLLTGTDFGDNINAVLPDVIGATIGSYIGVKLADRANKPLVVAGSFQGSSLIAGGSGADTLGGAPSATDAGVPASANERAGRVSLWQRAKNFFGPVFGPIGAAIKDRSISPILRGLGITAPGSSPAPAFNLAASANTVEELVVTGLRRARDLFTQSRIIQTLNSYRSVGRARG